MVQKATKKPITIEFVQYDGANSVEIEEFTNGKAIKEGGKSDYMTISTLEGEMIATTGDYIIKGIHGEFYPCKPDIFIASYDIGEHNQSSFCQKKKFRFIDEIVEVEISSEKSTLNGEVDFFKALGMEYFTGRRNEK